MTAVPEQTDYQWLVGSVVGLLSGVISTVAGFAYLGGGAKATLEAHDRRLADLQCDIRDLRDSIDRLTRDLIRTSNWMPKDD